MNIDKENIAAPIIEVKAFVSVWEKYRVIKKNDLLYIEGYNEKNHNNVFEYKSFNNNQILFEFILLFHNLGDCKYISNIKKINKEITKEDTSLILKFCKKYGLPCWGSFHTANIFEKYKPTDNETKNAILYNVQPLGVSNEFVVGSFIMALKMLYQDFLQIVVFYDLMEDISIIPLVMDKWSNLFPEVKKYINLFQSYKSLDLYTPSLNSFDTFWDGSLQLQCNNLCHLAVYYLCIFASQKVFSGGVVKQCLFCGKLFIAQHKQVRFCNNPCTRQAYYIHNKRKHVT